MWNGRIKLLGPQGVWTFASLDKNDGQIRLGPNAGELRPEEIKHMRHMLAWSKVTGLGISAPGVAPVDDAVGDRPKTSFKRAQLLLKDVKPNVFFDSVAQVGRLMSVNETNEAGHSLQQATTKTWSL